jgi:RHS repeat-associated protein
MRNGEVRQLSYADAAGDDPYADALDPFGRVKQHQYTNAGGTLDHYTYTHDIAGNRLSKQNIVAANQTTPVHLDETYAYDEMFRLIGTERGDLNTGTGLIIDDIFSQEWDLDQTGNWNGFDEDANGDGTNDLEQDRTTNEANELTGIGATTGGNWADPVYDRNGNMIQVADPHDLTQNLDIRYDAWNRVVSMARDGVIVAAYEYDGLGRRIVSAEDSQARTTPDGVDTWKHYLHNGIQVIEQRNAATADAAVEATQVKYQWLYSPRYIDAVIFRAENTDTDGLADDNTLFYLTDANYNITAVVNTSGAVVERYSYNAYGKRTIYNADWSTIRTVSAEGIVISFTGRWEETPTGLMYFRARFYSVDLGQFISRDPKLYVDGPSLYRAYFVPNGMDPTGTMDLWNWWYYYKGGQQLDLNLKPYKSVLDFVLWSPETIRAKRQLTILAIRDIMATDISPGASGYYKGSNAVLARYNGNDVQFAMRTMLVIGSGSAHHRPGDARGMPNLTITTLYGLGNTWIRGDVDATLTASALTYNRERDNLMPNTYERCTKGYWLGMKGTISFSLRDEFKDVWNFRNVLPGRNHELLGGMPYEIVADLGRVTFSERRFVEVSSNRVPIPWRPMYA